MSRRVLFTSTWLKRMSLHCGSRFVEDPIGCSIVRTLLTATTEPPLHNTVPERPCIVVLAEDIGVLHSNNSAASPSWHSSFRERIPTQYGMSYASWSLADPPPSHPVSFDAALTELKEDLGPVLAQQNTILVARGPWISWMAQYYLESLPLSGLVMVDPLPLDDDAACAVFEHQYKAYLLQSDTINHVSEQSMSREFALYQDYMKHSGHWALKLEPGVIPMLVLSTGHAPKATERLVKDGTTNNDGKLTFALRTAARHSVRQQHVRVVNVDVVQSEECVQTICEWVEQEIL